MMHLPLVLDYLRNHTLAELEKEHGVCSRISTDLSKVSLNYDQCMSKKGAVISDQCRGMVIRPRGWPHSTIVNSYFESSNPNSKDALWRHCTFEQGVDLLAWPMCRFYNDGDVAAADIDWQHARILEKLDGTMIVLYWDPLHRAWCTATRSVPDADLPVKPGHMEIGDMTFGQLFWRAWHETINESWRARSMTTPAPSFEVIDALDRNVTHVFELTSPYNKVVVEYPAPRITLLAARDLRTGLEIDIRTLPWEEIIPIVKEWPVMELDALKAHVNSFKGRDLEGAVILDASKHPFARRKVKNRDWLMASMFKDTIETSRRGAMRFILDGTWDDASSVASPEVRAEFERMATGVREYFKAVDQRFIEMRDAAMGENGALASHPRKAFALRVQELPTVLRSAAYFRLWEEECESTADYYTKLALQNKLSDTMVDDLLKKADEYAPVAVSRVFSSGSEGH